MFNSIGFDILTFTVCMFLIFVVLMVRAIFSLRIFNVILADLPENTKPSAFADLYQVTAAQLEPLGFRLCHSYQVHLEGISDQSSDTPLYIFCHSENNTIVSILLHPLSASNPDQLNIIFQTYLADGRVLSSQVKDTYMELIADEMTPAQTLDGETLQEQLQQHNVWCHTFHPAQTLPFAEIQEQRLPAFWQIKTRLIQQHRVSLDAKQIAHYLRTALRGYFLFIKHRPKPACTSAPFARCQAQLQQQKKMLQQQPSARCQWGIFLVSCLLSVGLGSIFFGLEVALILLGVIVLHEGGHFIAMHLFGYRNLQILALPLLGGVVIGSSENPSATKSGWIAMMGPLPGILLGWALLISGIFFFVNELLDIGNPFEGGLWFKIAICLLAVNYLNLLPIPPLDGHHLLQSIFPPRFWKIRFICLILSGLAGTAISIMFDLWLLAGLILFSLYQMGYQLLQERRYLQWFEHNDSFHQATQAEKETMVLAALYEHAQKPFFMEPLLNKTLQITKMLEQKPMKNGQRVLLISLFVLLFAIPCIMFV